MTLIFKKASILRKQSVKHTPWLLLVMFLLLIIGMANLYSAAPEGAFYSQCRHLGVSLIALLMIGLVIPLRWLNTYAYPIFALISLALIVVLILGYSAGGAQRWMTLFGTQRFQPSEFAKLSVVLAVSRFFHIRRTYFDYTLRDLAPLLGTMGALFILIFKQPDFGTAGVCLLICFAQILFLRVRMSRQMILGVLSVGFIGAVVSWNFFLRPYQKLRVLNLIYPGLDPSGSGYNSLQSLVAIGSGGVLGKGFFNGTQTQLQFLPARQTDFIFAVFAEEHGFWGGILVFLLFTALTYIALEIANEAKEVFTSLLGVGVAALIFIEFAINVAMVLGLFPVVGVPLPFFSYGGTSMLTMCVGVGILILIDRENVKNATRTFH